MIRAAILAFATCLASSAPEAASFDCGKAETPDEKVICEDRSLNDLDVETAVRFEILKELLPMGNRAKLLEDQEVWLKERHTCQADLSCLRSAYTTRLKILRGVFSEFAKQGPL